MPGKCWNGARVTWGVRAPPVDSPKNVSNRSAAEKALLQCTLPKCTQDLLLRGMKYICLTIEIKPLEWKTNSRPIIRRENTKGVEGRA